MQKGLIKIVDERTTSHLNVKGPSVKVKGGKDLFAYLANAIMVKIFFGVVWLACSACSGEHVQLRQASLALKSLKPH